MRGPLSHHASTGLKDVRRGYFQFMEGVFRSVQAFRSSQFQFSGSDAGTEDEGRHAGTVSDSMNLQQCANFHWFAFVNCGQNESGKNLDNMLNLRLLHQNIHNLIVWMCLEFLHSKTRKTLPMFFNLSHLLYTLIYTMVWNSSLRGVIKTTWMLTKNPLGFTDSWSLLLLRAHGTF